MNHTHNDLSELEARVSRGESGAEGELLSKLEPQMVCMVRRALRSRPSESPLDRLIRAETRRVNPHKNQSASPEEGGFVRQVAQRVCAAVIDRLRPHQPDPRSVHDTITTGRMNYRFVPRMDRMRTLRMPD